jgi:subtilisin family serine protease
MAAGTSMSSPAVSGIIAMMLQLNPTLTPDSVKSIIALTAITDGYTGILPSSGNNTWGHGKINAYKALKYMATLASVENTLNDNPTKGNITITYKCNTHDVAEVAIYDIAGKAVYSQKWPLVSGYNSMDMSLHGIPKGIYFTKISVGNKYKVIRTVCD